MMPHPRYDPGMNRAYFLACVVLVPLAHAEPPAIPLITHDPYFSAWSMSSKLTDDWPRHWSGATLGMSGLLVIDGKPFRYCGPAPSTVPAAEQVSVEIGLTATTYQFVANGVALGVEFRSPLGMADDPARASESISSITYRAKSLDAAAHDVHVYLDLSGEWCSNSETDRFAWSRHHVAGLDVLSLGKVEQPVLEHTGDQRKIDWGRIYFAGPDDGSTRAAVGSDVRSRRRFLETGRALESDDLNMPRAVNDSWPVLAMTVDLGKVEATASRSLFVGYDERRAIELFERPLRPFWQSVHGDDFAARLKAAREDLVDVEKAKKRDEAEQAFIASAGEVGGKPYARLVTLAFRQVLAGNKIVADWDGTPLMFPKENTSNGCLATVDVIYPACPFFLFHDPALLEAQLLPLLQYARSSRWKFPFAPHDLGQYPKANGQVYGGGETSEENQMPVEESGNMLVMLGALAKVEGNADFSKPYQAQIDAWAEYLRVHGLDPANQLCTDDFAGHLARNANLSAKTCVALGAYSQLLAALGRNEDSQRWRKIAEEFAARWLELAAGKDATVLVFREKDAADDARTWSQKYNLIWDRVLGLHLFQDEVFEREMAWYRTHLQKFGLPLDNRRTYTKLDWTFWSACLTGKRADFETILAPVYAWSELSPPKSRVPLTDWYETTDGSTMGMHTRTVVGGIWMPLLMKKLGIALK